MEKEETTPVKSNPKKETVFEHTILDLQEIHVKAQ